MAVQPCMEWMPIFLIKKKSVQASFMFMVSAACAAAITSRNHFFRLYRQNKSATSKVKFRQVSNHFKRGLEAAKLNYSNKTNKTVTSQKPGSRDFWWIANGVLKKDKSAIPSLFNGPEVLFSAYDKEEL